MAEQYTFQCGKLVAHPIRFHGDNEDIMLNDLDENGEWVCGIQWDIDKSESPLAITKPRLVEKSTYPRNPWNKFSVRENLKSKGYRQTIHYLATNNQSDCVEGFNQLFQMLVDQRKEFLEQALEKFEEHSKRMLERHKAKCK